MTLQEIYGKMLDECIPVKEAKELISQAYAEGEKNAKKGMVEVKPFIDRKNVGQTGLSEGKVE
jgi:hypothetical protein